jgi:hypothetical protein
MRFKGYKSLRELLQHSVESASQPFDSAPAMKARHVDLGDGIVFHATKIFDRYALLK